METITIALTKQEVKEANKQADKYYSLIQNELALGSMANVDNIARYTKEYKIQMALVENQYIEMPKIK